MGRTGERHALELHDDLVQGLTAIHWALEAGAYAQASETTRTMLTQAQVTFAGLLAGDRIVPGSLRRRYNP
jgi:hypothetical protein